MEPCPSAIFQRRAAELPGKDRREFALNFVIRKESNHKAVNAYPAIHRRRMNLSKGERRRKSLSSNSFQRKGLPPGGGSPFCVFLCVWAYHLELETDLPWEYYPGIIHFHFSNL